jgi:Co/Zn/Cd efflux system component
VLLMLVAVTVVPIAAIRYVRPADRREMIGVAVLGLAALGFAAWLVGQGDESAVAAVLGSLGVLACLAGLHRSRTRA